MEIQLINESMGRQCEHLSDEHVGPSDVIDCIVSELCDLRDDKIILVFDLSKRFFEKVTGINVNELDVPVHFPGQKPSSYDDFLLFEVKKMTNAVGAMLRYTMQQILRLDFEIHEMVQDDNVIEECFVFEGQIRDENIFASLHEKRNLRLNVYHLIVEIAEEMENCQSEDEEECKHDYLQ